MIHSIQRIHQIIIYVCVKEIIIEIVLYIFIAAAIVQLLFWGVVFTKLALYTSPFKEQIEPSKTVLPISVIVCARNEEQNLKERLPSILNQDYPEFEVLVVNDRSTDGSSLLLEKFSRQYKRLRILEIKEADETVKGKKYALSKGIEHSIYETLLLTDADCKPASKNWISEMVKGFDDERKIVLGFGPYERKKGFLNKFIRYETAHTALQYFSLALWGMPYMGVGRNLAYRKELYLNNKGFERHKQIASGDDDLFIREIAIKKNTSICLENEGFTYSRPVLNYKKLYVQKLRHFSTGKHYKKHIILILSAYSASHFAFLLTIVAGIKIDIGFSTVISIYLIRMILQYTVFGVVLRKFKEEDLIKWIPLFDILYVGYYILFMPAVMLNKKTKQWK